MDTDDDDVPLFNKIEEPFRQAKNKQLFIAELDVVFHQIKKFDSIKELADFCSGISLTLGPNRANKSCKRQTLCILYFFVKIKI